MTHESSTWFNLNFDSVKTNKSAVCIKGAKNVSKSLYNNPRWTLMPNFDLCQYYPTGKPGIHAPNPLGPGPDVTIRSSDQCGPLSIHLLWNKKKTLAAQCGKYMEISLKKLCRCGSGKAIVARRGAGFVFKSYMKQYRGRQWDIFAFCDGFGC